MHMHLIKGSTRELLGAYLRRRNSMAKCMARAIRRIFTLRAVHVRDIVVYHVLRLVDRVFELCVLAVYDLGGL